MTKGWNTHSWATYRELWFIFAQVLSYLSFLPRLECINLCLCSKHWKIKTFLFKNKTKTWQCVSSKPSQIKPTIFAKYHLKYVIKYIFCNFVNGWNDSLNAAPMWFSLYVPHVEFPTASPEYILNCVVFKLTNNTSKFFWRKSSFWGSQTLTLWVSCRPGCKVRIPTQRVNIWQP